MIQRVRVTLPPLQKISLSEPVEMEGIPVNELYDTLYAKYYLQYEEMENSDQSAFDRQDFHTRLATLKLLERLRHKKFFRESKPAIDLEFVLVLLQNYRLEDLRTELNTMYAWLIADPKRQKQNYRRFINTWMAKWKSNGKKSIEIHNHYHGES
jgi:hypothetical protein